MENGKVVKLLTPDEVRRQLVNDAKDETVETITMNELSFIDEAKDDMTILSLKKKRFEVEPDTLESIFRQVGIPTNFFLRCNKSTKQSISRQFLETNKKEVQVLYRENRIKSILSTKTPYVPTVDIFDAAQKTIGKSMIETYTHNKGKFIINWITEIASHPLKAVNDISKAGITIEIGKPSVHFDFGICVGGFIFRLICTNGMITSRNEITQVKGKDRDEILANIKGLVSESYEAVSKKELPRFMHMAEVAVDDPANVVNQMARQNHIPRGHIKTLLDRVPMIGHKPSMYAVINLVTAYAKEIPDYYQRRKVQTLGGEVLKAEHKCPTCLHALKS